MELKRQRLEYLDIAKGIGIILVILAHIGISGIADTWMYSFHLPLFYIVSGYCFNYKSSFKAFLGRRIRKCLVPYFCLGTAVVATETYTGYLYEKGFKNNLIRLVLQKRYSTLWFLATLFVASLLFWLVVKICRQKPTPILIVSILISIGAYYYAITIWEPLFWNADVACFVIAFLGMGYYLSKGGIAIKITGVIKNSICIRTLIMVVLLVLNIIVCFLNVRASGWRMDMYWNQYGVYQYTIIAAISGGLFTILLSYSMWQSLIREQYTILTFLVKGLRQLGKNSIIYFAWHQSVVMAPMMIWLKKMEFTDSVSKIIVFCGIMIVCTIADMIIRNTKLKVIIGE